MHKTQEELHQRVIRMADEAKEFVTDVDGFVYWWPEYQRNGHMDARHLRWLADELDNRNKNLEQEIEEYFKKKECQIGKIKTNATANFPPEKIRQLLNLHYINSVDCNELDEDGNIISKKHENMPELIKSHLNICPNISLTIEADVTNKGNLINFKILNER